MKPRILSPGMDECTLHQVRQLGEVMCSGDNVFFEKTNWDNLLLISLQGYFACKISFRRWGMKGSDISSEISDHILFLFFISCLTLAVFETTSSTSLDVLRLVQYLQIGLELLTWCGYWSFPLMIGEGLNWVLKEDVRRLFESDKLGHS